MQYALICGLPVMAEAAGHTSARCLYCGQWVDLDYGPGMATPGWFHKNDAAAILCSRERAKAQAELYEAIGVEPNG